MSVRVPPPVHVEHVEVDEGDLGEKGLAERGGHAGVGLTQPEGRRGEKFARFWANGRNENKSGRGCLPAKC